MNAEAVQTRSDLDEYLSQSARAQYVEFESGPIRQLATLLKTYIVELHDNPNQASSPWPSVFSTQSEIDRGLTLLATRNRLAFFADRLDDRIVALHTIDKTDKTDAIVSRITMGVNSGIDRAWMPSSFVLEQSRGRIVGYKLAHEPLVNSTISFEAVSEGQDDEPDALSEIDVQRRGFRLSSSSPDYAYPDLKGILSGQLFVGRRAVDALEVRNRLSDDDLIQTTVYSSGKIISRSTSVESHMDEAHRIGRSYSEVVSRIESDYWIRWVSGPAKSVRRGEPLLISLIGYQVPDLEAFVESLFSGVGAFGLLGITTRRSGDRFDVEATDLHRGDPVSFEVTSEWIRLYLPEHSCGNVVCRFVWNLQRYVTSSTTTTSASSEVIFTEGTLE